MKEPANALLFINSHISRHKKSISVNKKMDKKELTQEKPISTSIGLISDSQNMSRQKEHNRDCYKRQK